jgi:hypothetical protein
MLDTVSRYLQGLSNVQDAYQLTRILAPLADRYSSQPLVTAGLVINAGGAAFPKIGATDFYAIVAGSLVKIAAATAMPSLLGINAPAGGFNVACFYVDGAGALTALGGVPAATLGAVLFPQPPAKKSLVGFLIITNAGAFTGGTTALDGGTTIYVSPIGPCDPTVLT